MIHEQAVEEVKVPHFPLDPESSLKQSWDLFIMIFLMYTTFSVPYMLAFVQPPEIQPGEAIQAEISAFDVFEILLDCLFCTDVCLNFCTAFTDKGVYHTSLKVIAQHYLKTWFFLDFFGSVPFDKIVTAVLVSGGAAMDSQMQSILSGIRMIRVLKMVRAVRFLQKLGQIEQKDTTGTLKYFTSIFRAIFGMVFVAHFLACFFYMIIDTGGDNWMTAFDPELMDVEKTDNGTRYVMSLYWAVITISTIGYGDVLPVTHTERIFCLISGLLGGIVFAFTLGNITSLISVSSGASMRFEEKLVGLKEYLEFRNFDTDFKRMVLSYLGSCWRTSGMMYDEIMLLEDLPRDLRAEALRRIARSLRNKSLEHEALPVLLHGMSEFEVGCVVVHLIPRFFEHDIQIFMSREEGCEMYFVEKGSVVLEPDKYFRQSEGMTAGGEAEGGRDGSEGGGGGGTAGGAGTTENEDKDEIMGGGYFGELCLFQDICTFRHETATAKAMPGTGFGMKCLMLTSTAMDELKDVCPKFWTSMRELCSLKSQISNVNNAVFKRLHVAGHHESRELDNVVTHQKLVVLQQIEAKMEEVAIVVPDTIFEASTPGSPTRSSSLTAKNFKSSKKLLAPAIKNAAGLQEGSPSQTVFRALMLSITSDKSSKRASLDAGGVEGGVSVHGSNFGATGSITANAHHHQHHHEQHHHQHHMLTGTPTAPRQDDEETRLWYAQDNDDDAVVEGTWIKVSISIKRDGYLICLGSNAGIHDVADLMHGPRVLGRVLGWEVSCNDEEEASSARTVATPRGSAPKSSSPTTDQVQRTTTFNNIPTVLQISSSFKNPPPPPESMKCDNSDKKTFLRLRLSLPQGGGRGGAGAIEEQMVTLRMNSETELQRFRALCSAALRQSLSKAGRHAAVTLGSSQQGLLVVPKLQLPVLSERGSDAGGDTTTGHAAGGVGHEVAGGRGENVTMQGGAGRGGGMREGEGGDALSLVLRELQQVLIRGARLPCCIGVHLCRNGVHDQCICVALVCISVTPPTRTNTVVSLRLPVCVRAFVRRCLCLPVCLCVSPLWMGVMCVQKRESECVCV